MCSKRPARGRATLGSQRKRRKSVTPDPKEKQTCGEKFKGPRGTLGSARLPLVLLQSEVCVVALGEDSSVLVAEQCQLFVANTRSEGRVMTSILQEEPHHSIMVACEKDCLLTRKYLPEKRCYLRGGIMGPGHGLGQGTSCLREVRGTGKTSPGEERGNLSGDVPTLLLCCSFHLSHKLIPHGNLFCISSLSCRHQAAGSG